MRLRGPDDSGFIDRDAIYFGHCRLAILDPDSGKQPWIDPLTGAVLVFNGELFNFWELRAKLLAMGAELQTRCDTELLMYAYRYWGRDCLIQLNGMFAFAVYDPADCSCWLVRDRLGVKPLYYHFAGKTLRFASSMKALFAFKAVARVLDHSAAAHYLRTIRTTLGRQTLIKGIYALGPGESLLWRPGSTNYVEPSVYWNLLTLSRADGQRGLSFSDACEETKERFRQAVKRQMISDVPLGGFLSGGIDSSILAAEASRIAGMRLGTFSVGYEQDGYQEWDAIRENVSCHELTNEEIHLQRDDYADDWQWLIAEKGQPLSTPNEVPIYRLASAFGSRFKVALSGEGADEVFGGYVIPTFCAFDWARYNGAGPPIDPVCFRKAYGAWRAGSRQEHFFRVNSWLSREKLAALFDQRLSPAMDEDPVDEYYRGLFAVSERESTFGAYLKIHARVNLEGLLSRLDSSTMAASVEGRVPFTDHEIVEWLFSLPDTYKMRLREGISPALITNRSVYEMDQEGMIESKCLLRQAYADCLPKSILTRPKMSFPVPFAEILSGPLKCLYQEALHSSHGPSLLLRSGVQKILGKTTLVDPMLAWPVVNLYLWQREFGVDFSFNLA